MLYKETVVNVADNTKVRSVRIIHVYRKGAYKPYASIGDTVKVSIERVLPHCKYKKGELYQALVVRTRKGITRQDGTHIRFFDNSVILLASAEKSLGNKILGMVPREYNKSNNYGAFKKQISNII